MLKVCIATTAFPRWPQDDRGTFIWEAARAIQSQGAQVRVIAMHSPGAKPYEIMDSIEIIRPRYLIPERLEVLQKVGGGLPIIWRASKFTRLAIFPFIIAHTLAIARHARDCDIIHANWTLSAAAAWAGQFYHQRPILVTVQGSDIFQAARLPVFKQITTATLNHCTHVLALSQSLARATVALGIPANHVQILPNGVDTEVFRPCSTERLPLLLFVGSLIERKGVKYLIQAWSQVRQRFPDYHLVIVGEGPQYQELLDLVQSLGISDSVQFTGSQTPQQVSHWMQQARLFVLPSLEEGQGVVLVEALASGTPCVGSNVGGIPDVITSEVGILVPPRDADALADAIRQILSNQEHWEQLSIQARKRAVEHYSWDVIGKRLMNIYQSVLSSTYRKS